MARVPPHDTEAEEAVLASMLSGVWYIERVLSTGIQARDFYVPANAQVFAAAMALYAEPAPVDGVSIAAKLEAQGKLEAVGGRDRLANLLTRGTPHPAQYAKIVTEYSRCRDVASRAASVEAAAWSGDLAAVADALGDLEALGRDALAVVEPPMLASALARQEATVDWVVPHLLARQEAVLFVAKGGSGKTTLMRQMAAMLASGVHPFTRVPIPGCKSLTFDFQDPQGPAVRATRAMIEAAGDSYGDLWWVELRRQGVDLTQPRDQAWFEAKVAAVRPDVIFCGPVYNMTRGGPGRKATDEESVGMATRFMVDVMVRYDCAVVAEAHAPHEATELRVRGSKLWEDWAAFGFGLHDETDRDPDGRRDLRVERFRYDREMYRQWPARFHQGHGRWPWDASDIPNVPGLGRAPQGIQEEAF